MNKDEILERSRKENKDQDLFEKEVSAKAGNIGAIAAAVVATFFFVMQILLGIGMEYGLYAVVFSIPAAGYTVKAVRMKGRRNIVCAVVFVIATLVFSIAHITELLSASTIL